MKEKTRSGGEGVVILETSRREDAVLFDSMGTSVYGLIALRKASSSSLSRAALESGNKRERRRKMVRRRRRLRRRVRRVVFAERLSLGPVYMVYICMTFNVRLS